MGEPAPNAGYREAIVKDIEGAKLRAIEMQTSYL
jgi:hypothetical protein